MSRPKGPPQGDYVGSAHRFEGSLVSLRRRAHRMRGLLRSRRTTEQCSESQLPWWRQAARTLARWVDLTVGSPARSRPITQGERASISATLDRVEGTIRRLEQHLSAVARPTCGPRGAAGVLAQTDLQGYPEDWEGISLAYRRKLGFICEVCGAHAPDGAVHHIHPVSRGGDSSEENLLFLCRGCHALEHPHLRGE